MVHTDKLILAAAAGAQSKDGGAKPTSMMRAFAVAKSSFSMAEVRVVYRRYSSHPAFNEMAVGLHLQTVLSSTLAVICDLHDYS